MPERDAAPLPDHTPDGAEKPLSLPLLTRRGAVLTLGYILLWYATWNLAGLLPGGSGVSLWYPTAGLTMALLLAFGPRYMPLAFVAGFVGIIAADRAAPSVALVVFAALGSCIPVLCYGLAAWFLRTVLQFDRTFSTLRAAAQFLIVAPIAAMGTSLAAVAPVFLSGGLPTRAFIDMWLGWWLGDLLGILTVTPALLIFVAPAAATWANYQRFVRGAGNAQRDRTARSRASRVAVIISAAIGVAAVLAASGLPYSRTGYNGPGQEFWFLLFLPMIWIGIRYGAPGAAVGMLSITMAMAVALAVSGASVSSGPYQLLIGSMAALGLALGAAVSARNAAMATLEMERRELERRVEARTRDLRNEVDRRARAETQAKAAQAAAEAASTAKSAALSQMTHEFRTPLNAIIGFSDMMRGEILGPLGNGKYRQYADHVHSSGRHLLAMLSDIIDLSRVEAGQVAVSSDRIDLCALATEATNLLRPESDRKGIALHCECPGSTADPAPAWIIGDECRLRQILLNLLSNAIKYTPGGGSVDTAIAVLNDGRVRLTVKDTGHGIDADDLPHLGQPFFRGHHAERLQESGSGIGLTVVYQYARLHGATVAFDSTVGEGTTVTVVFPEPSDPGGEPGWLSSATTHPLTAASP